MGYLAIWLPAILLLLSGCSDGSKPGQQIPIPDTKPIAQLPAFAKQENEIEVADSMNDVDPTWVLGSIVNIKTGMVRGLDNYLSPSAKPVVVPQTEVVFKDFIENSLAANAAWLDFLSAQLNDKVRAELSVIKTSKVTMKNEDLDKKKLVSELQKISRPERADYGIIIGYIDFVLSASLFKDFGTEARGSGYGAKIGGSWYSKFENTSANHRVIAIWSPLPFVVDNLIKPAVLLKNLDKATLHAVAKGELNIKPLGKPVEIRAYVLKRMGDA